MINYLCENVSQFGGNEKMDVEGSKRNQKRKNGNKEQRVEQKCHFTVTVSLNDV